MQKLDVLWESEKAVCIIYGDAGTGKSGVVKDLISRRQEQGDEFACFLFSSTDLDVEEESLFLRKYGNYQLEDLFTLYSQEKRKVCVIESAEKFSALNSPQVVARRLCSGPICGAAEHLSGPFGEAREIRQGIHPLFAGCYPGRRY